MLIGLEPVEWSEAIRLTGKASPFIGEVLDSAFNHAQGIVVILSPDDEVRLSNALLQQDDPDAERQFKMQPRPNVLFEAGMGFGRNPDRTILIEVGQVKAFSDIAGRHVVRLNNTEGRRKDLADRLKTAGCAVVLDGDDWKRAGDFVVNRLPQGVLAAAPAPAPTNAVKFVDLNYPRDSGLQARTLAAEQDANGNEVVLKLRGEPSNQTLIKKKDILPQ